MGQTMFNISEVHRLTGKARSTIAKHIESGDLSCIINDDGKKLIEASEITRVYRDFITVDENGKLKSKMEQIENKASVENTGQQHFEKLLDVEKQERVRERRQLEETIEHLRNDLEKSQERESRATLLLEYQTKDSDRWVKQMSEIEKRIANQESETEKHRRALIVERNKTFWQKLFG